jgi:hypothetical protein
MIRQTEPDLAKAVQELCDGSPTEATIQLLRSLTVMVPNENTIRLYGTNFDSRYMNEDLLDKMEGESQVFKAKDEGNVITVYI